MIGRRQFLAILAALPISAFAADNISVVEIVNFSCPRCRELETYRPTLEEAARVKNARFVFAPISWEDQGIARDQVYFAARLRGPAVEAAVRKSIFEATQDHNLPLENLPQVLAWLQQDISPALNINWTELSESARAPATMDAVFRAGRLAKLAAIPSIPTFVILKGDTVVHMINYELEGGSSAKLVSAVLDKLKGLK